MSLKIKKNHLLMNEMVSFVADVITVASGKIVDEFGIESEVEYRPALFEFSYRLNVLKYYFGYEIPVDEDGNIIQGDIDKVVWEDYNFSDEVFGWEQARFLYDACKEQVKINQEKYLASLRPADQMERLVDMLENILGGAAETAKSIDSNMLGKIVERLGSVDDKSIIDAVVDTQGLNESTESIEKPKAKRGRKPGSKNKPKEDKIIHLDGEMSLEDFVDKE